MRLPTLPFFWILALAPGCASPSSAALAADPGPQAIAGDPAPPEAGPAADPHPAAHTLALLPFEDVDQQAIDTVEGAIEHAYGWEVTVMPSADLPQSAWYKPRKRHRAEKILDHLHTLVPEGADGIMGLTRKDISTTKGDVVDWGICGLAESPGIASVVSTFRIKKKLGKGTAQKKKKKYLRRLVDLATHEFGHTLGLPHCPTTGCVMEDAKGTVLTFNHSTGELCESCAKKLDQLGFPLPSD